MLGFFNVIVFHVGDHPNVTGILAKWIARILSYLWALEMPFPGVFLRDSYRILRLNT